MMHGGDPKDGDGWLYAADFAEFSRSLSKGKLPGKHSQIPEARARRWVRTRIRSKQDDLSDRERVLHEGYLGKVARTGQHIGRSHWSLRYIVLSAIGEGTADLECVMRAYDSKDRMKLVAKYTIGRRATVCAADSLGSGSGTPLGDKNGPEDAAGAKSNRFLLKRDFLRRTITFSADSSKDKELWIHSIETARDMMSLQLPKTPRQMRSRSRSADAVIYAPIKIDASLKVDPPIAAWGSDVPFPSIDADCVAEGMKQCLEREFPCSVKMFYELFISDAAIFRAQDQHERRRQDSNVKCMEWVPSPREDDLDKDGDSLRREMHELIQTTPEEYYFIPRPGTESYRAAAGSHAWPDSQGPSPPTRLMTLQTKTPVGGTTKVSKLQWYYWFPSQGGGTLIFHTSSTSWDVPYGSYFTVEDRFVVEPSSGSEDRCRLRVFLQVKFTRSTILKGMITKNARKLSQIAYREWCDMAMEAMLSTSKHAHGTKEGTCTRNSSIVASTEDAPGVAALRAHGAPYAHFGDAKMSIAGAYMITSLLLLAYGVWILADIRRILQEGSHACGWQ